jgi:Fe-S cluster assembly ATP-binding protein
VSRRVEELSTESGLGVLAITHYQRLLDELRADVVHVLVQGRIVASGGPELVAQLEETGYAAYQTEEEPVPVPAATDPFADPLL